MGNVPITSKKLPGVSTILAVTSGRGGVGKTFVATSLALTLAKSGKKVGLLDADISGPTVFQMLGIQKKIIPTSDAKIIPIEHLGIKTVSMAGLCANDEEPIMWRGPIVSKIIQKFIKETVWDSLDFLIIDMPNGSTDIILSIIQNVLVDGMILVTTPEGISATNTKRIASMAALLGVPVLGIVENMRGELFGEGQTGRLLEYLRAPLLASIPMKKTVASGNDSGTPPVKTSEELDIIFSKLARFILDKVMVQ